MIEKRIEYADYPCGCVRATTTWPNGNSEITWEAMCHFHTYSKPLFQMATKRSEAMTEDQRGAFIAGEIWKWLCQAERLELVPWNKNLTDVSKMEGRKETLKELRGVIDKALVRLDQIPGANR